VVLIFYPKDFTPGCTRQLCAVRDDWSAFERRGVTVLGVNPADTQTHAKFAAEYRFPFAVVSDEEARIASAYGCRGPQMNIRTVYVIGRGGKVLLADRGFVSHERIFTAIDAQ
jgi:peroxiredoxin Q/BCP